MRMSIERKQRLPFIDSHTGVAQNHSDLFQAYRYRNPGMHHETLLQVVVFFWMEL